MGVLYIPTLLPVETPFISMWDCLLMSSTGRPSTNKAMMLVQSTAILIVTLTLEKMMMVAGFSTHPLQNRQMYG